MQIKREEAWGFHSDLKRGKVVFVNLRRFVFQEVQYLWKETAYKETL
jgi:hypothetical protein